MDAESRPLVTGEPVEFEKYPGQVPGYWKIRDGFEEIYKWNVPQIKARTTEISQHVTSWTWKPYDPPNNCIYNGIHNMILTNYAQKSPQTLGIPTFGYRLMDQRTGLKSEIQVHGIDRQKTPLHL